MKYPLYFQDNLFDNVLIFDGLTRTGRGLVAPLVSDLPGVDYVQLDNAVDHIPVLWQLGLLDDQSAASFLRMTVDGCAYARAIGRHLNTRYDDQYSIYQSLNTKNILKRAFGEEGQPAIDRFNGEGLFSSFIVHFQLQMAKLWFMAFPNLRIVLTVRHPVDVCTSWQSRKWGSRFGKDPLSFWPIPEIDGNPVPWFAVDFAQEYIKLNPMSRIVKSVIALNNINKDTLLDLSPVQQKQVKTACFEKFATEPVHQIKEFAKWLNTSIQPEMDTAMAKLRTPRKLDIKDRKTKLGLIKENVEPYLFEQLIIESRNYETEWGLEPVR